MPRSQVCDRDTEITFIRSIVKDSKTEQFGGEVGRKKVLHLASAPGCHVLEGPRSSNATIAEDPKCFLRRLTHEPHFLVCALRDGDPCGFDALLAYHRGGWVHTFPLLRRIIHRFGCEDLRRKT
jgi:hypothetical protein